MTGNHGHRGPGPFTGPAISRRRFMQTGAGVGASLVLWHYVGGRAWAQPVATSLLDAGSIPKFAQSLVIPPAMPRSGAPPGRKARGVDYYRIGVRQFDQQILPESMGLRRTAVWNARSVAAVKRPASRSSC